MDIGERIREMRKDKKMTQRELAALTGVAENTIRQYELHLRKPKVEQLKSIARVFDCSLDYLTGADDEPETAANHLERVFAELGYTIAVSYTHLGARRFIRSNYIITEGSISNEK